MADPRLRALKIKTGVVKRLTKEKTVYEREVGVEQKRLEKFKADGSDEHVLKKQEEVIQECLMMIPDTLRRLKKEQEELEKLLLDIQGLEEFTECSEAEQVLIESKKVLAN